MIEESKLSDHSNFYVTSLEDLCGTPHIILTLEILVNMIFQ